MKIYRIASIRAGWITPNGEICEISERDVHWAYVSDNPVKFGLDKKDVDIMNARYINLLAFGKGAIRYHSCDDGILNLECTRNGLSNKIDVIHKLYNRFGCDNGLYVSIISDYRDSAGEEMRIDDISDLYSYANSIKIYRVSKYDLGHQFWILSNGVIRDLGSEMHISYIKNHIGEFGIDESMLVGKEFSSIPYYRYAFKSGAIRVVITNREFTINCNRGALKKHINVLHSLYKKYCNDVRIILEFNEGDGYNDSVNINDIEDLYNYANNASNAKIYKISMEMRELKEKPITGDEQVELTHLINLLHEIEYKNKMLQGSVNFIHPKRKVNIELRLKQYAWVYFKYIKAFTIECFNMWNNMHPTESADKWADMVMESYRESYGADEDIIKHFVDNDNKLEWHSGIEYDLTEAPINRENVKEYLEYVANDNGEGLLEDIRFYLESTNGDVDSANLDMAEDDQFIDYFIENLDVNLYVSFIDINSIRELVKTRVYRDYMIQWGGTVEDIKINIKDAIDRMDGIGEDSSISEMTMAISLALNVQHASGTVLIDMGDMAYDQYIIGDINSKYLDLLSELDVSDWEAEFHKEFAI